jgi:hypothetical protein
VQPVLARLGLGNQLEQYPRRALRAVGVAVAAPSVQTSAPLCRFVSLSVAYPAAIIRRMNDSSCG